MPLLRPEDRHEDEGLELEIGVSTKTGAFPKRSTIRAG